MTSRSGAIFLAALTLAAQTAKEPDPKPCDVQEVYEIYSAALKVDHPEGTLLIADTTVPFNQCLESRTDAPTKNAIDSYRKSNATRWRLQRQFKLSKKYKLLTGDEIEELRKPDPNGGFFWRFPPGVSIIHFSAVGFSSDRTIAFVEMDVSCGGQCGHGRPFVFQKRNGKWNRYDPVTQHPDGTFEFSSACSWNY